MISFSIWPFSLKKWLTYLESTRHGLYKKYKQLYNTTINRYLVISLPSSISLIAACTAGSSIKAWPGAFLEARPERPRSGCGWRHGQGAQGLGGSLHGRGGCLHGRGGCLHGRDSLKAWPGAVLKARPVRPRSGWRLARPGWRHVRTTEDITLSQYCWCPRNKGGVG